MKKALPLLAGWLLIVEHGIQFAFMVMATFGTTLFPVDSATLERHGIRPWTLYYGPATALIESIALIALAVLLLRGRQRAYKILLWVLPVVIAHSIAYSMYIDLPLQGAVFSAGVDIIAWLVLLAGRPPALAATAPARRLHW